MDLDEEAHRLRLERLDWVTQKIGEAGGWQTFPSGDLAATLLAETRRCFVDGQFLAAVVLGLAFMERVISAHLREAGESDINYAGGIGLVDEALNRAWISENEHAVLDHVRKLRGLIEQGATEEKAGDLPITGESLELEARAILVMVYRLLSRKSI